MRNKDDKLKENKLVTAKKVDKVSHEVTCSGRRSPWRSNAAADSQPTTDTGRMHKQFTRCLT
ncbi:hypothetical protein F9C07_5697 [Aspergillus flavus]|uniref:Uncharacterized protein n=1 Tax=Aspergillus flavus (strain ATCC 200026 / FGSC A1120 / IAM 13836 / NRRL 3357 / JCM 12722 / SRRC 167) TaxID=332952 RepID=A0A7U2MXF6_ASPFN|nr:hypothetical protein F9C07_5697 [Aspergillus flavus]